MEVFHYILNILFRYGNKNIFSGSFPLFFIDVLAGQE
jgi:hypothetical protein